MASIEPSSSSKPSGCTMTSTLGECDSSRSSIGVNFTWAGPRRAKTWTSLAALALRPRVDVVGDLGDELLVGGLGEHTSDVEADVADAEHGDRLGGGVERPVAGYVGVAVVPVDEVGRAVRALEVDAGDVEVAVGARAGREDDGVVELLQVVELEVGAVVDVAEEADAVMGEHALERLDDLLDPRVVRRDAVADQAERGRVPVEDVDRDVDLRLGQDVRGVDACRSGADHGDPQLPRHATPGNKCL